MKNTLYVNLFSFTKKTPIPGGVRKNENKEGQQVNTFDLNSFSQIF